MEVLNLIQRPLKNQCWVYLLRFEGKYYWTYKYRPNNQRENVPYLLADCLRHPLANCAYYLAVLYKNGKVKMIQCEDNYELIRHESIVSSSELVEDYIWF